MANTSTTNCSVVPPTALEFLKGRTTAELILIVLAGVLTLIIIIIYVENAVHLLRQCSNSSRTRLTLWLTGMHPLFAFTSIISLCIPRTALLNDFVATIYLSVSIYCFMHLMIGYHGGEEKLIQNMADMKIPLRSPPLACCCCCCPEISVTRQNLQRMKSWVFQVAITRPVLLYVASVILANRKSITGAVSFNNAFIFISVAGGISTVLAMYSLVLLFRASIRILREYYIFYKFLNLQLVLTFNNLQSIIFQSLNRSDLPACRENTSSASEGNAIHHMLLIAEMFLLSLLARRFYRDLKDPVKVDEMETRPRDNMGYEADVGSEKNGNAKFNSESTKP